MTYGFFLYHFIFNILNLLIQHLVHHQYTILMRKKGLIHLTNIAFLVSLSPPPQPTPITIHLNPYLTQSIIA